MMTYDGFDFSRYMIVNDIGRPLMPPQVIQSMEITGRHGAYFLEKRHAPIVLPVEVTLHEDLNMSYMEMKRYIAGNLNKKEPKKLIFEDEPDMSIHAIITDNTEIDDLLKAGTTTLHFYCPDPFYYAIEDEVFTFNGEGSYDFTRAKGNEESEPLIEIQGMNSGGVITLKTDHSEINFEGALNSGETLVFDSHFMTAYVLQVDGTKRSANNDIDSLDFPILAVGANNVTVSTENASVSTIRIYARSRWI
ncbi:phage tail family protein [Halalkalibacterium halodurans]|uniref:distal tail protein Dit n=1 Tax=Halalkalibacterium halodurans TaxID=86665 RepID=UPI002E1F8AD2|nr:distal tail protein Dit [Halalkalibacterium halodurans]MED3647775.1 phage tail family protein [Halalkalibacterium halodurans]MED4126306.1 phage tail family protein [Halalkalibacterium halodurans]